MKPLILAVDTTHEIGGLALLRGENLLEEVEMHAPTGFAQVLYGHLRGFLDRQGITVADVDCFAAASGPGTFTGVRVGLACVKGLAEAAGKPAVGVSNLQALAWYGAAPLRAVAMDARRGEVYAAVYDDRLRPVSPEVVTTLADWLGSVPQSADLISPDLDLGSRTIVPPRALARAIAEIAAGLNARGEALNPAALDANYVRRPL